MAVVKVACKENILASNTGNAIFVKGKFYSGECTGDIIRVKDEFGAFQSLPSVKDKFFKTHFKVIEDGS